MDAGEGVGPGSLCTVNQGAGPAVSRAVLLGPWEQIPQPKATSCDTSSQPTEP